MIIQDVSVYRVEVPREFWKNARRESTTLKSALVKISTDDGVHGFGETGPKSEALDETLVKIKHVIGPLLIGQNPLNMAKIQRLMDINIHEYRYAKDGVESALFDLVGKILGVPVHILLGGKKIDQIPLVGPIAIQGVADSVKDALRWTEKGFGALKVKIGLNPKEDFERLKAVREAVGDGVVIRVDANQGYPSTMALRILRQMEDLNIQAVEQPVPGWDIDGMKRLAQELETPISADESIRSIHDAATLIKLGAVNLIKVKVQGRGGIKGAYNTLTLCDALGAQGTVGRVSELSLGAAAEIHVAAASEGVLFPGEMVGPLIAHDDIVKEPLDMEKGTVVVPDQPGLGLEIDEGKLEKYGVAI